VTKALCWLVGALLALAALASWDARKSDVRADRAEREVKDAQLDKRRWQAKYAIQSIELQRVDTVYRVARARVDTLRDSLVITDTLSVIRYVAAADSALQACSDLADSCRVFRTVADSTMRAMDRENAALRQYAESVKPSLIQKRWWVAALGGVAFGAWIRGQ
jgi:hypothetical protein